MGVLVTSPMGTLSAACSQSYPWIGLGECRNRFTLRTTRSTTIAGANSRMTASELHLVPNRCSITKRHDFCINSQQSDSANVLWRIVYSGRHTSTARRAYPPSSLRQCALSDVLVARAVLVSQQTLFRPLLMALFADPPDGMRHDQAEVSVCWSNYRDEV